MKECVKNALWRPGIFHNWYLKRFFFLFAVPVLEEHSHLPDVLLRGVWDEEDLLVWSLWSLRCSRLWKGKTLIHYSVTTRGNSPLSSQLMVFSNDAHISSIIFLLCFPLSAAFFSGCHDLCTSLQEISHLQAVLQENTLEWARCLLNVYDLYYSYYAGCLIDSMFYIFSIVQLLETTRGNWWHIHHNCDEVCLTGIIFVIKTIPT